MGAQDIPLILAVEPGRFFGWLVGGGCGLPKNHVISGTYTDNPL